MGEDTNGRLAQKAIREKCGPLGETRIRCRVGISLMVQWLRRHLPTQGMWVQFPSQGVNIPQVLQLPNPKT